MARGRGVSIPGYSSATDGRGLARSSRQSVQWTCARCDAPCWQTVVGRVSSLISARWLSRLLGRVVTVMGLASIGPTELSYESVGSSRWYSAAEINSESEGNAAVFVYSSSGSQLKQLHCVLIQATTDAVE